MTSEEHEAALKRVDDLMSAEAGTPEAEELDRLVTAIVAYEDEHFPLDEGKSDVGSGDC